MSSRWVSNIQLASVVSDTFGKSSQRISDKILENPDDTSFDIEPLIHGSMKKKNFPNWNSLLTKPEQAGKLKVNKKHFDKKQSKKLSYQQELPNQLIIQK